VLNTVIPLRATLANSMKGNYIHAQAHTHIHTRTHCNHYLCLSLHSTMATDTNKITAQRYTHTETLHIVTMLLSYK
jgi:hypothetical protein